MNPWYIIFWTGITMFILNSLGAFKTTKKKRRNKKK
tara:strand:+ start:447 stop:554 length:108 start_codon:yes stop_codon:yes gene_type:complete